MKFKILAGLITTTLMVGSIPFLPFNKANFNNITIYVNSSNIAMIEANSLINNLINRNHTITNENNNATSKITTQQKTIANENNEINSLTKKLADLKKQDKKPLVLPNSITSSYNLAKFYTFRGDKNLPLKMAKNYYYATSYYHWANYWKEKASSSSDKSSALELSNYYKSEAELYQNALTNDIQKATNLQTGTIPHSQQASMNNITLHSLAIYSVDQNYKDAASHLTLNEANQMINANNIKNNIIALNFAYMYWTALGRDNFAWHFIHKANRLTNWDLPIAISNINPNY